MMTVQEHATNQALQHLGDATRALLDSRNDGFNAERTFLRPQFQAMILKLAREKLEKAIEIIERTEWVVRD